MGTSLRVARALEDFVRRVGEIVSWLALSMVLAAVCVVVLRYGFSIVFAWLQESTLYMHAALFMIGASYTLVVDEHVRVDLLYRQFSLRKRAWIELLTMLLIVVPLCLVLFYTSFTYVTNSWAMLESSQHMRGIPAVFLLKTLIWVFAGLLMLATAARAIRSYAVIAGGEGAAGGAPPAPEDRETTAHG